VINGLFTQTVIFSVGCNSRIRHRTRNRILPIFCAVLDAAVASNTEYHIRVNRPLRARGPRAPFRHEFLAEQFTELKFSNAMIFAGAFKKVF
jgi:bifunctional DNase/RNase